jgi:hypothetical protein
MIWHRFPEGRLRIACSLTLANQAILISNSDVGLVLPHLFLGTEKIPWCDDVTDLEVVGRQVTKVCSKVYATLYRLRLLKFLTPKRVRNSTSSLFYLL